MRLSVQGMNRALNKEKDATERPGCLKFDILLYQ